MLSRRRRSENQVVVAEQAGLAEARDDFALLCESAISFSVCFLARFSGLSMLSQVVGDHLR